MMKKIYSIIFISFFSLFTLFSNDLSFSARQEFNITDTIKKIVYTFDEDDIFTQSTDKYGIGVEIENPLNIIIRLHSDKYNKNIYVPISNVFLNNNTNSIPQFINKDLWIPAYYYECIKNINCQSTLLTYETYWKNKIICAEDSSLSWQSEFGILKYYFDDFYFVVFGRFRGFNDVDFLAYLEEVSAERVVYNVQQMYSNSFHYLKKNLAYPNQPEFLPLYERETPFKIIFTIDGDYMYMYIDEVSDKNLFQTLVRTTPEACDQIENYILGKSKNLSAVVMPKHGTSTSTKTVSTASTNVAVNKTLTTNCNLKLRSGEATSTQVLTVMSAGTKVKILELGKAETIDGINSNWVKVEVQSGAKDRDGKAIKAGTIGWCYGGYLE